MNIVTMQVNGVPYQGFMEISASKSVENFSGSFSFTTVGGGIAENNIISEFPIKIGQSCVIAIDDESIINGYIETIRVSYSDTNHVLSITGRDRTGDIVDSTLGGDVTFTTPISLKSITEQILKTINISAIKVSSNVNLTSFKQGELIDGDFGSTAFEYIAKFAAKKQVLATTDGDGNIVFQRSTGQPKYNTILDLSNKSKVTISSATVSYDHTKRFYQYIASSQSSDVGYADTSFSDSSNSTNINSTVTDSEIRKSRVYNFIPDQSLLGNSQAKDVASWTANYRRSQSFIYNVVVQGFHPIDDPDKLWLPNMKIAVIDQFSNINANALISEVSYLLTLDKGAITQLKIVTEDAFTLAVQRDDMATDDQPQGDEYTQ